MVKKRKYGLLYRFRQINLTLKVYAPSGRWKAVKALAFSYVFPEFRE